MNEFELIRHYFTTQLLHRADVMIGIGDDAAVVSMPAGQQLVVTTDTLIEGVHFPLNTTPHDIGHKSLAVNLSDLAAMGAAPAWITLALTLPSANERWLEEFCSGFFTLANRFQVQLIGGDITHGPLSITVQALGHVPAGQALTRSGAKAGDLIYVTGTPGDAGLALQSLQHKVTVSPNYLHECLEKLNRPEPRIATGLALRKLASAAIDVSDGLAADLGHILQQSKVGARLNVDHLPLSEALARTLSPHEAIALALSAGDDYELCFTVPPANRDAVEQGLASLPCRYTCIGSVTAGQGLHCHHQDGSDYHGKIPGYQHF